jgi:hypothetical protein
MEGDMESYTPKLDAYKAQLRQYSRTAVCGREFYLVPQLFAWLRETEEIADNRNVSRLELLLLEAYRLAPPNKPRWREDLLNGFNDGEDCCLKVFCILMKDGLGHLIQKLYIKDSDLPCDIPALSRHLRATKKALGFDDGAIERLAALLHESQYAFYAPVMGGKDRHYLVDENVIAPICKKEKINDKGGGIAEIWRIEIPGDYLTEKVREVIRPANLGDGVCLIHC